LIGLGQATGLVIASIHERRDEFRRELQQAAGLTSDEPSNAIKRKTLRRP
jgi:monovalent cation:H+ antiporter-2, CPA2 family